MPASLDESLIHLLYEAFPDAVFNLSSRNNDNVHYTLEIYTDAFKNKSILECHRMVHAALSQYVGEIVHALSLKTGVLCERKN